MKKVLLSLILLLAALSSANAQLSLSASGALPVGKYASKDLENSGYGAGLGLGAGLEYAFKTQGIVKPVVGFHMLSNWTKKSVKEDLKKNLAASSLSGGGYGSLGFNAGVKVIHNIDAAGTHVFVDLRALMNCNFPGTWNYECQTGSNSYSKYSMKFRKYWRPGFVAGVGIGVDEGSLTLSLVNSGKTPYAVEGESSDGESYTPWNILLTWTFPIF